MDYFRIGNGLYRKQPVSERRKCRGFYSKRVEDEEGIEAIIIRDDSEGDGSGYIEYQLFSYLICVSKQFDDITE